MDNCFIRVEALGDTYRRTPAWLRLRCGICVMSEHNILISDASMNCELAFLGTTMLSGMQCSTTTPPLIVRFLALILVFVENEARLRSDQPFLSWVLVTASLYTLRFG